MIAFTDNDEATGLFRREIFISEHQDGRTRVEERTFNDEGQHTDSDFDLVGPQSQNRWGHLLNLTNDG
jgi:hypothetical protein